MFDSRNVERGVHRISEKDKIQRWDRIHERAGNRDEIRLQYDGWLEIPQIANALSQCRTPVLDLGGGIGIDTLHLIEGGAFGDCL